MDVHLYRVWGYDGRGMMIRDWIVRAATEEMAKMTMTANGSCKDVVTVSVRMLSDTAAIVARVIDG